MTITDVEAIHLRLPKVEQIADGTQDVLVIRIHTDAGLVGVGEVSSQSYVCKAIFELLLRRSAATVWPIFYAGRIRRILRGSGSACTITRAATAGEVW